MKTFEPGDLIIVNRVDQPCCRLIAEVKYTEHGQTFADYIDARTSRHGRMAIDHDEATHLLSFGVRIAPTSQLGFCTFERTGPSSATYKNGGRRVWQPEVPEYFEIANTMSDWIAGYLSAFYFKYYKDAEAQAIADYVLPFIQDIQSQNFADLSEVREKAERINVWANYDRTRVAL